MSDIHRKVDQLTGAVYRRVPISSVMSGLMTRSVPSGVSVAAIVARLDVARPKSPIFTSPFLSENKFR